MVEARQFLGIVLRRKLRKAREKRSANRTCQIGKSPRHARGEAVIAERIQRKDLHQYHLVELSQDDRHDRNPGHARCKPPYTGERLRAEGVAKTPPATTAARSKAYRRG